MVVESSPHFKPEKPADFNKNKPLIFVQNYRTRENIYKQAKQFNELYKMKKIPVRHITTPSDEPVISGRFKIRDVADILGGSDLVHDLHRHDFFFILAVHEGAGIHEIDFIQYAVNDNSIYFLRPGQVHKLELKSCTLGS